jgi:hypothetical protein
MRMTLCLGVLVCLTVVGAAGAGAQTGGSGSGSGSGPGSGTTTTQATVSGNTTTTVSGLALTGEQAAIPLAAAAGIIVLVLGARQLRRRSNN